jgi:hypothetical protein
VIYAAMTKYYSRCGGQVSGAFVNCSEPGGFSINGRARRRGRPQPKG